MENRWVLRLWRLGYGMQSQDSYKSAQLLLQEFNSIIKLTILFKPIRAFLSGTDSLLSPNSIWFLIVLSSISKLFHHHLVSFFFIQGEEAEEHPFLSYKPIKEGIYSVVYDSSLSQLQAFSICMALAESRKMSELTLEHKSSRDQHKARAETLLVPGPRFKA